MRRQAILIILWMMGIPVVAFVIVLLVLLVPLVPLTGLLLVLIRINFCVEFWGMASWTRCMNVLGTAHGLAAGTIGVMGPDDFITTSIFTSLHSKVPRCHRLRAGSLHDPWHRFRTGRTI